MVAWIWLRGMLQGAACAAWVASGYSSHVLSGQGALVLHNDARRQTWDRMELQLSPAKCASILLQLHEVYRVAPPQSKLGWHEMTTSSSVQGHCCLTASSC